MRLEVYGSVPDDVIRDFLNCRVIGAKERMLTTRHVLSTLTDITESGQSGFGVLAADVLDACLHVG